MRLPDSLSPLRDRRFAYFYAGITISLTGSVIAPIALTFAVLDLTGNSATALGQVLAARSIPLVLFLLIGGVVADRFSRSTVMRVSNSLSALTQGAVAVLLLSGHAQLWELIVLEAANGTVSAFTFPAMQGLVPQIVQRSHLQQANAMLSLSRGSLAIIGPSIGALFVVTVGSGWAIAIDALSWAVASIFMALVRMPAATTDGKGRSSMWHELVDGWSTFRSFTWVWVVVLAFGVLNMISAGAWSTLGPVVAKQTIGIPAWGIVVSADAVGAIAMTLVLLHWRIRRPLFAGMIGVGALALPMLLLGLHPATLPLAALALLGGVGTEVFGIGWSTALQEHIPNNLLSRVSSYDALGSFVAIPLGELLFGPLGGVFPVRDILVVSGAAYLVIVAATLGSRSVRDLQHHEHADESAAEGVPEPTER